MKGIEFGWSEEKASVLFVSSPQLSWFLTEILWHILQSFCSYSIDKSIQNTKVGFMGLKKDDSSILLYFTRHITQFSTD